jgi:hypothetical protein
MHHEPNDHINYGLIALSLFMVLQIKVKETVTTSRIQDDTYYIININARRRIMETREPFH